MGMFNVIRRIEKLEEEIAGEGGMNQLQKINLILEQNKPFLIFLLQEQLFEGKDRYNKPVLLNGNPEYQDITIRKKHRYGEPPRGQVTSRITNYYKGHFYRSISVKVTKTRFTFDASVKYYEKILARSGPQIMQLSRQSLKILRDEIIRPELKAMNKK